MQNWVEDLEVLYSQIPLHFKSSTLVCTSSAIHRESIPFSLLTFANFTFISSGLWSEYWRNSYFKISKIVFFWNYSFYFFLLYSFSALRVKTNNHGFLQIASMKMSQKYLGIFHIPVSHKPLAFPWPKHSPTHSPLHKKN